MQRKTQSSKRKTSHYIFLNLMFCVLSFAFCVAHADTVIMKDGTVYKGKILIDSDKALLIGNPPFDNVSHLLETGDIDKIIYQQYHSNPPSERKRGPTAELRVLGNVFSSTQLSLGPAAGLYAGLGFRLHPAFELNGGINWLPALHSGNSLAIMDGTHSRGYQNFRLFGGEVTGRLYPFYEKPWKTEPFLTAGYGWDRLTPSGSGDLLTGSGWQVGFGAMRALTTHLFLEARFIYESTSFGHVDFLGQSGSLDPDIPEHRYAFSMGLSYRI